MQMRKKCRGAKVQWNTGAEVEKCRSSSDPCRGAKGVGVGAGAGEVLGRCRAGNDKGPVQGK